MQRPPLGLAHHQFDRLGVALVLPLHLRQQSDPGDEGVFLHLQLHVGVPGLVPLFFAGVHPQLVALDNVLHRVPLLHGVVIAAFGCAGLLSGLLQSVLQLMPLPADSLVPVHNLLGCGGQGRQQRLGLSGPGCAQIGLAAQVLQLPGQGPCGAGGLLRLPALGGQGCPALLQLAFDLLQAALALANLFRQRALPALLLLQIGLEALGGLQIVLNAAF